MKATVIGAGLAGCEAANQIAKKGIKVDLYEMKPKKMTPAHSMKDMFAEAREARNTQPIDGEQE